MLKTQQEALNRAVALLAASGVRYAVQMPDGSVLGNLRIRNRQPTDRGMRRTQLPNLDEKYKWTEKARALEAGAVLEIECDCEDDTTRLARNVSAFGSKHFGSGNFIAGKNGMKVELLRVS